MYEIMNKEKEVAPAQTFAIVKTLQPEIIPQSVTWPVANRAIEFKVDVLGQIIKRYMGHVPIFHHPDFADSLVFPGDAAQCDKVQDMIDYHLPRLIEMLETAYAAYVYDNDLAVSSLPIEVPESPQWKHGYLKRVETPKLIEKLSATG